MLTLWGYEDPYQLALPGFNRNLIDDLSAMPRKLLGLLGELTAWRALEAAGYTVKRSMRRGGDLRVIDQDGVLYRVEVKTARQGSDGNWRFCLMRRLPDRVATDFRHSDVVVLLAVLGDLRVVPFVVPSQELHQNNIVMCYPVTNRGKFARFRQLDSASLTLGVEVA